MRRGRRSSWVRRWWRRSRREGCEEVHIFGSMKRSTLKGVKLLTDETENRRYVQIDLATLVKEPEAVDEYLDGLIAQARRSEPTVPHEQVMQAVYKRARKK
jgi:hypothetical protein